MHINDKKERILRKPGLDGGVHKPRVVSLPPSLASNSTQSSVYSNQTSRFSGIGSPPIIDFTEWADNFRGQRFGFNDLQEFTSDAPRSGLYSMLPKNHDRSPRGWRIEYPVLIDAFRLLMDSQGRGSGDILNAEEIAVLHEQDRDCRLKQAQIGCTDSMLTTSCIDGAVCAWSPRALIDQVLGVIGKPMSEVFMHASSQILIAGTQHLVPTLVAKCVEELYRTGLYQPQLFRRTPNFVRVEELVEIYDHRDLPQSVRIARQRSHCHQQNSSNGTFGAETSLHMETTENICALLRTFLQYLPEPILSPCLFDVIWNCCSVRQEAFQSSSYLTPSHARAPLNRLGCTVSSEDLVHFYAAQIILHLLPTPNFSLIVYLISFFSQVVMVHEENGLAIDDVASMFGVIVFGGATERIVSWTDTKPRARGEIMMKWFLRRWRQIYHGLFPYDEEGRPASSGVNIFSPTRGPDDKDISTTRPSSGYFGLTNPKGVSRHDPEPPAIIQSDVPSSRRPTSDMVVLNPALAPTHSGLLPDAATHEKPIPPTLDQLPGSSELASNYLEEVWPHLTSDLRMRLNERMIDIMLEPLIAGGSKMSRQRSNSVPTRTEPLTLLHRAGLNDPAMHRQLVLATQRIAQLERRVYDNQAILQGTVKENQRLKKDKAMLEVRMKSLGVELEIRDTQYKKNEETVRKGLEETVEGVVRERDEARGIVSEIQRLSVMANGGGAVGAGLARNL